MRIIKAVNQANLVQFTCKNCQSILEASKDEFKSHFDRNETSRSITCPVCSKTTWLNEYFK